MKKRGKTPSLITGSSGKPKKVIAKRQRSCKRCNEVIPKDEECFEIPKVGGGFRSVKTYCKLCFEEILNKTKDDIAELTDQL